MTSEKELIKKLDEFAHPSMKFQMPTCLNGSQRLFDTHSLDTMNNKLFPSSVLNSKMILTPDSMRPMKHTTVQCDINHIMDRIKRKGSEKDSPASSETFKTSLSGFNLLPKVNSPNINEGNGF